MEFKEYSSDYAQKVVDLLNICFPSKYISIRSFEWKHFDPYFNQRSLAMLAEEDGKVCCFVCFAPVPVCKENIVYDNFYSCAVQATHPDHRKKGLVTKLTQIIERRLGERSEYIGFSNEDGVKIDRYSKKINYSILGQMRTRYAFCLPYKSPYKIEKVQEVKFPIQCMSKFFALYKDPAYLDHRYQKCNRTFEYFQILKDGRDYGFIVCQVSKSTNPLIKRFKYDISEVFLSECEPKLYREVFRTFSAYAFKKGHLLFSYSYLPNNFWHAAQIFLSLERRIGIYFTVKTLNPETLKKDNWMIQGGDVQ